MFTVGRVSVGQSRLPLGTTLGENGNGLPVKPAIPLAPKRKGKRGKLVLPDGTCMGYTIEDELSIPQRDLPTKSIHLQRVRFDDGREEMRLGYYIIGKKKRMRGKWVWGQFATLMPASDFRKIVRLAERNGWI